MMVLPMILIFIMPKMMNAADDETKKVIQLRSDILFHATRSGLNTMSSDLLAWHNFTSFAIPGTLA